MADAPNPLSDDEVCKIVEVIESLDRSDFEFMQLEFDGMTLTVGKGQAMAPAAAGAPSDTTIQVPVAEDTRQLAVPSSASAAPATASFPQASVPQEASDTIAIVAPMIGRFYAQPEPGAPPFVSLGSTVTEDTTVGLIEVMKTFNAVAAGVNGVIIETCVADLQMAEYGQVLFRVQPTA